MADFATLVENVYVLTNRRDLITQTALAVKSATLQLHRRDFFAKDLFESAIQFTTTDYLQSIDYRTLYPRYRSLKYLRKFDATAITYPDYGMGAFFEIITPEQVLDNYFQTRNDVAYIAGASLNMRSSTALTYAALGMYLNPEVGTPETYNSWIALEAPMAISYEAASIIQSAVLSDPQRAGTNKALANIEMLEIINSNILSVGS